jgi:pantetheine-phosphate adenylyltransferase
MTLAPRIAVYPGTFDPITLGHLDIIERAARLVDRLVIAVAENAGKTPRFDVASRVAMVATDVEKLKNPAIVVRSFDHLLVDFAREVGAGFIVRGLRTGSDYEYEKQMAAVNHLMCPDLDTLLMFASRETGCIASSIVKDIARLGGDVRAFVSAEVAAALARDLGK